MRYKDFYVRITPDNSIQRVDKTARAVSYKERDELIKDVEMKYPQKKKEIPIEYEELTAKKKTTVKT